MRPQDFIYGKLDDLKFRISFPGELITTQDEVDDYAIEFAEWIEEYQGGTPNSKILKELLEIFKKEKGW